MLSSRSHANQAPHKNSSRRAPVAKAIGLFAVGILALVALAGCGSTTPGTAAPSAVNLKLTSPTGGSATAAGSITVRGTVSPANAVVQIQGRPAAVGNGVFAGTATLHRGRTTIDVIGSAPGSTPTSTSIAINRPKARVTRVVTDASAGSAAGSGTIAYARSSESPCSRGLAVGPNTTCAFAENVRSAYDEAGPGAVTAYSPVTSRTYVMTCSATSPVVCTGGDNASVYISSYSDPARTVVHTGAGSRTSCGSGLEVGPNTTCAFAENVRSAYRASGSGTLTAYSPVTGRSYRMTCFGNSPVTCTGGNDASVFFP